MLLGSLESQPPIVFSVDGVLTNTSKQQSISTLKVKILHPPLSHSGSSGKILQHFRGHGNHIKYAIQ